MGICSSSYGLPFSEVFSKMPLIKYSRDCKPQLNTEEVVEMCNCPLKGTTGCVPDTCVRPEADTPRERHILSCEVRVEESKQKGKKEKKKER